MEDIRDLFAYIREDLNSVIPEIKINVDAIAVAGPSAGGLCTYLSAIHPSPKPKALLSLYGQAGECLVRHFSIPKPESRLNVSLNAERPLSGAKDEIVSSQYAVARSIRLRRVHLPAIHVIAGHGGIPVGVPLINPRNPGPSSEQTDGRF